jgi:hypothetical protein
MKGIATVAKVMIAAFALSMLLPSGHAHAKPLPKLKPPAITGDPIADVKTDLQNLGLIPVPGAATGVTKNTDGTVSCSFNIFANLNPNNLLATIQACVSDVNSTFEPDVSAALDSANAYAGSGDQTAIQCLQPALAIVQAGIGRPGVAAVAASPAVPAIPAVEAVPAQAATATSPAVPAVAAVAAVPAIPAVAAVTGVPAYKPGAITLFQKFREFTLAGGPTACQNWIQGTINAAVAPAVGAVAGVAGAAVLGGGL